MKGEAAKEIGADNVPVAGRLGMFEGPVTETPVAGVEAAFNADVDILGGFTGARVAAGDARACRLFCVVDCAGNALLHEERIG